MINGFEISFLTSCTLFNFEWFVITILGIVIFFKTIFWQWHIIFRNKVVIFYTALMIFYQIFFPISVKQQHVTPIKTTTLYLKILLDSDWKARLTDKNKNKKHCGQENFWQKKLFYCNLLTLIRFFNIRVRRKKTKNYYYQHDEALKKRKLYSSENRSVFVLDEIVWAKCFKICPYFWIIKIQKNIILVFLCQKFVVSIVNFVKHKTLYFWRVAEDDYFLLKILFKKIR